MWVTSFLESVYILWVLGYRWLYWLLGHGFYGLRMGYDKMCVREREGVFGIFLLEQGGGWMSVFYFHETTRQGILSFLAR